MFFLRVCPCSFPSLPRQPHAKRRGRLVSRVVDKNAEAVKAFAEFAKLGGVCEDLLAVRRSLDATMSTD